MFEDKSRTFEVVEDKSRTFKVFVDKRRTSEVFEDKSYLQFVTNFQKSGTAIFARVRKKNVN